MNIVVISGSPRAESITQRVALHLRDRLKSTTSHHIDYVNVRDWNLPMLEQVFNSVENTPDTYKALSEIMFAADAFILVTPEYNGSYTPALKNLLDHYPKQLRKAFGLVTATVGGLGGMRAAQQLLHLVPAFFGIASPFFLLVPQVENKFDSTGKLIDGAFEKQVHQFLGEFLWLGETLNVER